MTNNIIECKLSYNAGWSDNPFSPRPQVYYRALIIKDGQPVQAEHTVHHPAEITGSSVDAYLFGKMERNIDLAKKVASNYSCDHPPDSYTIREPFSDITLHDDERSYFQKFLEAELKILGQSPVNNSDL